jgi:uncharacterized damage-inducible protein DinB
MGRMSEVLRPELENELGNTRKMLAVVPEGKWDWKPHQKSMSLGKLAGHVATLPSWGADTFKTERMDLSPENLPKDANYMPKSREEMLAKFDSLAEALRETLSATPDEEFGKTWTLTWNGQQAFSLPRMAVYRSMVISHLIHHRGQLSVYLRMLEVPVPGMYGPSADEQPGKA